MEEVRRLLEISDKYEGADDRARNIVAEGIRVTGFAAFSSTSPLTAQEQGKIREYFGQWMLLRDQLSGLITPYEHNTFLSAKRNFDSACTSKVSDQVKVAFLDQALEDAHSVYASQTKRTDISFSSVLNKIFLARTLRDLAAMGRFDDDAKRSAVALLWECADEIIKISKPDLEVEYCKESYLHEIEYFRGQYSEEIEINPEENPDISTHNILTKLNQSDIESGQNPNTFMESAFSPPTESNCEACSTRHSYAAACCLATSQQLAMTGPRPPMWVRFSSGLAWIRRSSLM